MAVSLDLAGIARGGASAPAARMAMGLAGPDRALGGGLPTSALHEIAPAQPMQIRAASGFALILAGKNRPPQKDIVWIQHTMARLEGGALYGPGIAHFGVPPSRVLLVRAKDRRDALWSAEEALRCRAIAAVVLEITASISVDLTATRRLSLAAQEGGGFGFVLRHRVSVEPSAALTRWEIGAASTLPDRFGGLGRTRFRLSLTKNRRGPTGSWNAEWKPNDLAFAAPHPVALAQPAVDGPHRSFARRAG